jgi:hypothetical protein
VSVRVEMSTVAIVATRSGTGIEAVLAPVAIVAEIAAVGPQGPAGPAGIAASYTHTQTVPAASWTVNHNLGARPAVELYDTGGAEIEGEIVHTGPNQALVYFNVPLAGSAKCI